MKGLSCCLENGDRNLKSDLRSLGMARRSKVNDLATVWRPGGGVRSGLRFGAAVRTWESMFPCIIEGVASSATTIVGSGNGPDQIVGGSSCGGRQAGPVTGTAGARNAGAALASAGIDGTVPKNNMALSI